MVIGLLNEEEITGFCVRANGLVESSSMIPSSSISAVNSILEA